MSFFPAENESTTDSPDLNELAHEMRAMYARMEQLVWRAEATLQRIEEISARTTAQVELVGSHNADSSSAAADPWHQRMSARTARVRLKARREAAHARVILARAWASFRVGSVRTAHTLRIWLAISRMKFGRFVVRPMARLCASIRARVVWAFMAMPRRMQMMLQRARKGPTSDPTQARPHTAESIVLRVKYSWPIPSDITAACGSALALMTLVVGFSVFRNTTTLSRSPQITPSNMTLSVPAPIPIGLTPFVRSAGMSRIPISAPVTPVATSSFPVAVPVLATTRPMESLGQRFVGSLAIDSDPIGAAVYVNQERVGFTPLVLQDLRAGSHAVWVESEGYQRWSAGVLVAAAKRTRLVVTLHPTSGR